ncbi:Ig-like domain-containing protein (plasmid) [Vibrio alginolyticus]
MPANHSGACLYHYTISDQNQQASGILRVVVSPNTAGARWAPLPVGNQLTDINQSAVLGETLTLDLSDEPVIASDVASMTHPVFSETTIINGSGNATLTQDGQFTFKALASGSTVVTYTILDDQYTEDSSDDEVYIGQILIAVSGNANTPPTAEDGTWPTRLKYGEEIEIDVADFPGATDGSLIHDNDATLLHKEPLQLVQVQADDVFVALSQPDDVTNTKFKVWSHVPRAANEGYHEVQVHYAVYDHNEDGVAQGTITLALGKQLESITIAPTDSTTTGISSLAIAKGQRQGFVAIGKYDDGTQDILNREVTWKSDAPSVASINTSGVARGLSEGHTNISAELTPIDGHLLTSNTIDLEVTAAELVKFWLTPSHQELPLGTVGKLTATGLYTDGSTADLTEKVTWHEEPSGIVTIDDLTISPRRPFVKVHADHRGTTEVTAELSDGTESENAAVIEVKHKELVAVQLTAKKPRAAELRLAVGDTLPLIATAIYSDASTKDVTDAHSLTGEPLVEWNSGDSTIADFTAPIERPNRIEAIAEGSTIATATYKGITSNELDVIVSPAKVKALTVTPIPNPLKIPKGARGFLDVIAEYTDHTTKHVSPFTVFTENDTSIATVALGVVHGISKGETTVTATYTDKHGNAKSVKDIPITVTDAELKRVRINTKPNSADGQYLEIPAGTEQPLDADLVYTDGTTISLTNPSSSEYGNGAWSPDDATVATVTNEGVVTTARDASSQTAKVTVGYDGKSDDIDISVTDGVIKSIDVTPKDKTIAVGNTQSYTATASYTDDTPDQDITKLSTTQWSTASGAVATIRTTGIAAGIATGVAEGTTTVTARDSNSKVTGSTNLTVKEKTLESIRLDPENVSVAGANTANVTAWGTYDLSSTEEDITNMVSWNVDDETIAVISEGSTASDGIGGVVSNGTASDGTTTATAELDTIISSNAVYIDACKTLAGPCLDVFDVGGGKLFTSNPSVPYLDSIGGSAYSGSYPEIGTFGPVGNFYIFDWYNANTLCDTYTAQEIGGRTNWRLATRDELKDELFNTYGNMFSSRGSAHENYWSSTADDSNYFYVRLNSGFVTSISPSYRGYASCVSEAP